jgi:c-di-GMP-related signal transduction protein
MSELAKPEPDLSNVEMVVARDLDLAYKVMTWVNSAASGRWAPATTVREALMWMGLDRIRRFVGMFAMEAVSGRPNGDLLETALIRARMSDLIAQASGAENERAKAFLGGLFSVLEAILAKPMAEICDDMAMPDELRDLFEVSSCEECGAAKRSLRVATAWQKGEAEAAQICTAATKLATADLGRMYIESVQWVREGLSGPAD